MRGKQLPIVIGLEGSARGEDTRKRPCEIEAVSKVVRLRSTAIEKRGKTAIFVETGYTKDIIMSLPRVRWLERQPVDSGSGAL